MIKLFNRQVAIRTIQDCERALKRTLLPGERRDLLLDQFEDVRVEYIDIILAEIHDLERPR